MGSFFKTCGCRHQGRCSHLYTIRFRNSSGRQVEESGFPTQDDALDRLTAVYSEKRSTPVQQAELKREIGKQRFGQYAASWLPRQRHYAPGSIRTVNQLLDSQILPSLDSRRVNTFSSTVIEDFILSMEDRRVGLATQQNAFDTLKKILLDAYRRGGINEDPFDGVVAPAYVPKPITIPTLEEIYALKAVGSDGLRVVIDLMSGCGHRNGEAYAVNTERLVADDVYRITEQIDGKTREPARLKHRKPGHFRETPMPSLVRQSILSYTDKHGSDPDGYILHSQRSKLLGSFNA
ncbi:tyrosine-type recombinase/integrase [Streptomyces rubiginosohelvolus]